MKKFYFLFSILFISANSFFSSCQQDKGADVDVEQLISQMTLDEKLDFIGGYQEFNIRAVKHLGIPEIHFADGPVGVRNYGASTAYPASVTLAASFDKALAQKVGKAIAMEARSKNVHVMLAPGMNIYRFPLCGRNFEYLGEDPYLAGQIAAAYIQGMQGEGVVATAKHFAANNQEFNRHHVSSDVDERTLHEIYLPAFKTAITQGKVGAVMTSYNLVNGVHASQSNYLINQVLKNDWGFDGFVMSDWVSTYDGVACANAGLDLEMPSGKYMNPDTLKIALESGELIEQTIDDKIRRILKSYKRFGFFEHPDISQGYVLDSSWVRQTALDESRGGMVLLKNENILPLQKENLQTIAIIGPNGEPAVTGAGGSSGVSPLHPLSLVDAVKKVAGSTVKVTYSKGIYSGVSLPKGIFDSILFNTQVNEDLTKGLQAAFYNNKNLEGEPIVKQIFTKPELYKSDLCGDGVPENDFSVRFTGNLIPEKSGNYCFGVSGDDGYRLFIDGKKVLDKWSDHGELKAKYECELMQGKTYQIVLEYYQAGGDAVIRFGAMPIAQKSTQIDYLAEAKKAAQQADVVVMPVGFNSGTESEGFDRSYEMPYHQDALIEAVARVNPNIVVVLYAGGNVAMEQWIDKVPGLLQVWYPGQEGSLAAAEILFGETNPSGKLPATYEKKLEDNPAFNSYWDSDNDLHTAYEEGLFVGYRYYDQSKIKPRFPFGYGLSYTTFHIDSLQLPKKEFTLDEPMTFSVSVSNTGDCDGAEVVQVYVTDKEARLVRPEKELKAFEKVRLAAGETKTIAFELKKEAFSYYDPDQHQWVLEPGDFEIKVGNSSANILQKATIRINETQK